MAPIAANSFESLPSSDVRTSSTRTGDALAQGAETGGAGQMAAVLQGKVDAILLTGGIAHNPALVNYVKQMVEFIAPISVYPGEDEMEALAMNGLMVMRGEATPLEYK